MEFCRPGRPRSAQAGAVRKNLRALGYRCELAGRAGSAPVRYCPITYPESGRVPGTAICYSIGHHHVGLTLAALSADLVADLVAQRPPRLRSPHLICSDSEAADTGSPRFLIARDAHSFTRAAAQAFRRRASAHSPRLLRKPSRS